MLLFKDSNDFQIYINYSLPDTLELDDLQDDLHTLMKVYVMTVLRRNGVMFNFHKMLGIPVTFQNNEFIFLCVYIL